MEEVTKDDTRLNPNSRDSSIPDYNAIFNGGRTQFAQKTAIGEVSWI